MKFADELNKARESMLEQMVNKHLGPIRMQLIEVAKGGNSGLKLDVTKADCLGVLTSDEFIKELERELSGVKVVYEKEFINYYFSATYGYWKHSLIFEW